MPANMLLVNPRRKRKASRSRSRARRARATNPHRRHVKRHRARRVNPARRHHKRVRHVARRRARNPRMGGFGLRGMIHQQLIPAGIGAAGALALDVGLSYVPLPTMLQTGIPNAAVKIAGAIALGMIGGKVLGREKGKAIAAGALTVVAYNLLRTTLKTYAPSLPGLSGTDYCDTQVGAYMNGMGRVGYNPAPMLQGMGAYMDSNLRSLQKAQMGAYMDDGM
jgi:hypothetical protein